MIALNTIVKNESKVIERMLKSVTPFIDYYCITDTGSTDNTKEIIKNYFDSVGIPGEINDFEKDENTLEIDFESWRNHALQKLMESGKAVYALILDADEELNHYHNFDKNSLHEVISKFDFSNVKCFNQSGYEWYRPAIFNIYSGFNWYNPVHEQLTSYEPDLTATDLSKDVFSIKYNTDGNSWTSQTQQEKYIRYANVLVQYLEKMEAGNPRIPRITYYLAKCLYDGHDYESALIYFKKRAQIKNTFLEEQYLSQFYWANCCEILKKIDVLYQYLKCAEIFPRRADHIVQIILIYQRAGDYNTSYLFSLAAIKMYHNNIPENCFLSFDSKVYTQQLMQLHKINCEKLNTLIV